jgi:hypothetical protein
MRYRHVKIKLHGGGVYIQPVSEILNAIDGELDGVELGDKITIDFEPVELTDEEYNNLPEFMGH